MKQLFVLLLLSVVSCLAISEGYGQKAVGFFDTAPPRAIVFTKADGSIYESKDLGVTWKQKTAPAIAMQGHSDHPSYFDSHPPHREIHFTNGIGKSYTSFDGGISYWLDNSTKRDVRNPTFKTPSTTPDSVLRSNRNEPEMPLQAISVNPNPSSGLTTIRYRLTIAQQVRLSIQNQGGEEILVIVNEFQTTGDHTVSFDANAIPIGAYDYVFRVEGLISSGGILIVH